MYNQKVLPFYMTYPLPLYYQEEDTVTRDLEYLQQMYPAEAKKYQKIIAGMLDKLDYEGSMIYDEYPDRWQMYRLSQNVMENIRRQNERETPGMEIPKEKWEWMSDMVQILLFYEIYKEMLSPRLAMRQPDSRTAAAILTAPAPPLGAWTGLDSMLMVRGPPFHQRYQRHSCRRGARRTCFDHIISHNCAGCHREI